MSSETVRPPRRPHPPAPHLELVRFSVWPLFVPSVHFLFIAPALSTASAGSLGAREGVTAANLP